MERICDDLQLEESVEDLMHQFGADEQGQVSYAQFLLCHKKIQLTPMYQNPVDFKMMPEVDATTAETKVCRRRDNAKNAGEKYFFKFYFSKTKKLFENEKFSEYKMKQ